MGQSYELVAERPLPWPWSRYESWLTAEWQALLGRSPSESEVHEFLEQHPSMVPGGEGGEQSIGGHHGAFPAALISEPELPGLTRPTPDFMWISKMSSVVKPVLIEIERPDKRWFRSSDGVPHSDLTQAIDQISTWRDWFESEPHRHSSMSAMASQSGFVSITGSMPCTA